MMSSKADATMVPKAGKLDQLDEMIEVDELHEALAEIENIPNEESIQHKIGTAEAVADSQSTTVAPRRLEKARPRSKSATGIRPDVRNQSPVRNVQVQEPSATRPPVPPHKSAAAKDNTFTPRSQVEREPPRYAHRSGFDDSPGIDLSHQVHRGIAQVGHGGSYAERVRRAAPQEPDLDDMYQELVYQRRAAQHAFREAEYYKRIAGSLHKELEDCKKDLWEAQDEKKALGQQILDLGTVAEGVTDEVLRRLFQSAIGCAVESHSKVFGKPTGDDAGRLGKLLSPECIRLLQQFGRKYYHSLLASALFKETSDAVGKRYVVGAASGILKLTREFDMEVDPRSSLTFLQILEEVLHLPSIGVPQRDINIWRSSFVKLLQYLPEVSELANSSGSKASAESELSELVDEVWAKLEPHIPPGDKGRRSLQKLLKLQANLRLKTCMSLASYELKFHDPGTQFNVSTMSIVDVTEGECEDDELRRLDNESCGRKLVVGYCFFPALYKWGNDRGFDTAKGHVVARAMVLPVYDDDPFLQQQILESANQSPSFDDTPMANSLS
ncbi:hypothetical protein I7I53_06822 [Histoplasma capsulatum var. duboisii H88]|uniref:Uncharacterized protein n=3 Tax=Ajellomyces capsulatus TaxID=5037 RepID=A0A8A1LAP0_AJEC8|nr:hypothetical protein I7I53_06822 [Histoplasma capsulatum var. duboisii H88]